MCTHNTACSSLKPVSGLQCWRDLSRYTLYVTLYVIDKFKNFLNSPAHMWFTCSSTTIEDKTYYLQYRDKKEWKEKGCRSSTVLITNLPYITDWILFQIVFPTFTQNCSQKVLFQKCWPDSTISDYQQMVNLWSETFAKIIVLWPRSQN